MASPLLAMVGSIVIFALGVGAVISLCVLSAQGFMALFRSIGLLK